jgi:DNA repair protein RadC
MEAAFTRVSLTVERTVKLDALTDLTSLLGTLGLSGSAQEQLWVIALDSLNQVRNITVVSVGTYHDCFVSVPTILSPVLLSATDRFIIAHNHPNGRSAPTDDDIDLTQRVDAASRIMDLSFDDHIIVSPSGSWSSMRTLGHL